MNKAVLGVCTFIEIAGVIGLTVIGLKRNDDAYKAEMKCIDLETKLLLEQIEGITKDAVIKSLEQENKKLKKQLGEA